ncbi:MATE family efflux transporter [Roseibacillus ishigakijimensis]|uniref:Multidrug-efflux transporter n=1 Tax=Roseibacillus ishigakijimensis TaxID=454146 RepID=A0A934RV38_9BACT|nr:MATE family efflux transporter [Roseibacillus ishigakijimensis]MBK1834720.1 MATE family efflux transporter [Roseibacillus ishigakijimensis]
MILAQEARLTLKLAFPLVIGQVSQMLLGVADTVMLGQVGVTELAVLTFANSLFYLPFVFGIGVLTAISVFTANARGANQPAAGRASCRHGFQVATVLGALLALLFCALTPFLDRFDQPAEVVARTPTFYLLIMSSLLPALMAMALKSHADAMDRPWPAFWIFLAGVVLNIFLNWILIYGNLGSPTLGLEGAGIATLVSRVAIVLGMLAWLIKSRDLADWVPQRWLTPPRRTEIRRFFGIGFPASIQMTCEVAAFSAAALLIGRFGETALAAHQIALMCAATAFMVPLGLAMALGVRIGEAAGRQEPDRLRPIVLSGWLIAAFWALLSATVFLTLGDNLASLFNEKPAVISLAAAILVVVGLFQLFDSLQITASALLRGLHDTRVPALIGFVAYWLCGIPIAIWLSSGWQWRAVGVWWGLAAGLAAACFTLCWRIWQKTDPLTFTPPAPDTGENSLNEDLSKRQLP